MKKRINAPAVYGECIVLTYKVLPAESLYAVKQLGKAAGVIATDQKMSYTPIDHKPVLLDADQAKEIKTKIYNYLGLTESIVNSSYTEDEYAAFYESTLEPIAIALSQEFTAKVFNDLVTRIDKMVTILVNKAHVASLEVLSVAVVVDEVKTSSIGFSLGAEHASCTVTIELCHRTTNSGKHVSTIDGVLLCLVAVGTLGLDNHTAEIERILHQFCFRISRISVSRVSSALGAGGAGGGAASSSFFF